VLKHCVDAFQTVNSVAELLMSLTSLCNGASALALSEIGTEYLAIV
jgi:hypothetical protein